MVKLLSRKNRARMANGTARILQQKIPEKSRYRPMDNSKKSQQYGMGSYNYGNREMKTNTEEMSKKNKKKNEICY